MACRVAKVTSVTGYKMLILSGLRAKLGESWVGQAQKRAELRPRIAEGGGPRLALEKHKAIGQATEPSRARLRIRRPFATRSAGAG